MKPRTRKWNRRLWGIEFCNGSPRERPMLLGSSWGPAEKDVLNRRTTEPTRTLLFCHCIDAREWCTAQNGKWQQHSDPIVRAWRVRPVRVRETVQVIVR